MVLASDINGKITNSLITSSELALISGASSNIQFQIDLINTTLNPLASDLDALKSTGLSVSYKKIIRRTS